MYSLKAKEFDNVFDVLVYTVNAMKECGYSSGEIDDYLADAVSSNNYNLINVSIDELNECNKVCKPTNKYYEDSWRDYYYRDDCAYEGFNDDSYQNQNRHYLEDDDIEAYEGFDCCKNYTYLWNDPDEIDEDMDDITDFGTKW